MRPGVVEFVLGAIDGVRPRRAVDLEHGAHLRPVAAAHELRVVDDAVSPLRVVAVDHAGDRRAPGIVDGGAQRHCLVAIDDAHLADRARGPQEPDLVLGGVEPADLGRHPVPEPLVDRPLRRPQDRDGLAAIPRLLEEVGHHQPQDAAAPMRRRDADQGDAGCTDLAARGGQAEGVGAGAADGGVPIESADDPIDLDVAALVLELVVAPLLTERGRERPEDGAEGVIGRRPDRDPGRVVRHVSIVPRERRPGPSERPMNDSGDTDAIPCEHDQMSRAAAEADPWTSEVSWNGPGEAIMTPSPRSST